MYAMKKHINKVMAVFLCACLLLSYNPAFGAVDAAFADPANPDLQGSLAPSASEVDDGVSGTSDVTADGFGNWNAGTDVLVSTFDSELRTDATDTVYGTRAQIIAKDPNPIIVEATCATGKSFADYVFKWTVKKDGVALDDAAQARLAQAADAYVSDQLSWDDERKVARSVIDLRPLFANDNQNYVNNAKYEFECEVSLKADPSKKATETVVVYTVDEENQAPEYTKDRLESADTPFVVATGKFLNDAKLNTELAPGTESNITAVFNNIAANAGTADATYAAGTHYQVSIGGGMTVEDVSFPAFEAPGYTLWFPIDETYVYDEANNNRQGYKDGDTITLLWKGNYSGDEKGVQKVDATVVTDPVTNKLMAQVVYNDADHSLTGANDAKYFVADWGVPYPGFFALMYPSNKAKPGEDDITYYNVDAIVTGAGGTIPQSPGQVRTGTETSFDIVPQVTDSQRYRLATLMFTDGRTAGAQPINLLSDGVSVPGVTIDAARSHVIVGAPLSDAQNYGRTYKFEATFELVQQQSTTSTVQLNMSVVDENGSASDRAVISAEYTKVGESALASVQTSGAQNTAQVAVQYTGQANLTFMAHAPENGTTYGVKKVETSVDGVNWAEASFAGGKLSIPYMDKNMYVRVTAGEVENTTLPTYWNVTVVAGSNGSVDPTQGIVAVNPTSTSGMLITMTGDSGFYPSAIKVKEGTAAEKDGGYTNTNKSQADTYTYVPSTSLNGDVTITVEFTSLTGVPYELTVNPATNGTVSLSGNFTLTNNKATVYSGTALPFLIVPDANYRIGTITFNGQSIPTSEVTGGVYAATMPPNDATLSVTFVAKSPSEIKTETRTLGIYVADESLNASGATDTNYIWASNAAAVSPIPSGTSTDVSVAGKSSSWGEVNSSTALTNVQVAAESNYMLNMIGQTYQGTTYEVDKILVVEYTITDAANNTKRATSRTLYNDWNSLVFNLGPEVGTADVIVFFKPRTSDTVEPLPSGNTWNVTVSAPDAKSDWQPGTSPIEVVKNGYITLSGLAPKDDTYEWASVVVNGTPISASELEAVKTSGDFTYGPVTGDTTIAFNFTKKDDPNPPTPAAKYKVNATSADGSEVSNNGSVQITVGAGQPVNISKTFYQEVEKGTDFKLGFTRNANYRVSTVAFTWPADATGVHAYYKLGEADGEGTMCNWLVFSESATAPSGYTGYTPYTKEYSIPVPAGGAYPWRVAGIMSDVTVMPTFIEGSDVPPTDDSWTVRAGVGSGEGTVEIEYKGTKLDRSVVNVLKGSTDPVTVTFNPDAGYEVANVRVERSSDNVFVNIWNMLTGGNTVPELETSGVQTGKITLTKVEYDYNVYVDFKKIDGSTTSDTVAVNVFSDPQKGVVAPSQNVRVSKTAGVDSTQQFIVSPAKDESNDRFYTIKEVQVTYTNNNGTKTTYTVAADNESSPYITWDSTYKNVFTLNAAVLGLNPENLNAIDVEVVYSDRGELTSTDNIVPPASRLKNVTITSNVGGTVSPRGSFTILPRKVDNNGTEEWYKQMVVVSPAAGYKLTSISVTRGGSPVTTDYFSLANNQGFFYITADDTTSGLADEVITVRFDQQPLGDRTYNINVTKDTNAGSGNVVPKSTVCIPDNQSYTYTVSPSGTGVGVIQLIDKAVIDGQEVDLPSGYTGVNWTRAAGNTNQIYEFTVNPITGANGEVVDRKITVVFGQVAGAQPIPAANKTSILVSTYGPGRAALSVSPNASLKNIYKSQNSRYVYNITLGNIQNAVADGYRIYCIEVNGKVIAGSKTPTWRDLMTEQTVVFDYDLLSQTENYLYIYADKYTQNEITGWDPIGSSGGGFDYGYGEGGIVIGNRTANAGAALQASTAAAMQRSGYAAEDGVMPLDDLPDDDADASEDDNNDSGEDSIGGDDNISNATNVFTVVPGVGFLIDHVYLYNCYVVGYEWLSPSEISDLSGYPGADRTEKIALRYTLQRENPDDIGYLYATYKQGPAEDQEGKWDPKDDVTQLDGKLNVEFTPMDTVIEVVPLFTSSAQVEKLYEGIKFTDAGTIMLRPDVAQGTSAGPTAGYTVKYNTTSIDGGQISFVVDKLIDWNDVNNEASKLYTIDVDNLADGVTVEKYVTDAQSDDRTSNGAGGTLIGSQAASRAAADEADSDLPAYYTRYVVTADVNKLGSRNGELTLTVPLKKLSLSDGTFPEYTLNNPNNPDDPNNPDNPDDPNNPDNPTPVTYTLEAIAGEGGSLTPTSTTASGSWSNGNTAGPWEGLASGSTVAFRVTADDGYVLTALTRNSVNNCLGNGEYSVDTGIVTFRMTANTTLRATFAPVTSSDAMRTVTIEVEGSHGTTSPAPGSYQVQKGKTYPVTFQADTGYVPYRIWVDGVQSYVSPTLTGWMLPASWSDQTFKVEFALAGTTPTTGDYLNQAGQNLATQAGTVLTQTGDNPWALATLALVVVGAGFAVVMLRRRKATAERVAKYSVTRRR